ncbi:MAG: hypothetical protein AAFX92_08940 [Pseudomonadota bacterium]
MTVRPIADDIEISAVPFQPRVSALLPVELLAALPIDFADGAIPGQAEVIAGTLATVVVDGALTLAIRDANQRS